MHTSSRSAISIAAALVAIGILGADTSAISAVSASGHRYCIRLLGDHATPLASKQIVVSSDDEARSLASEFLNEYDSSPGDKPVAFPFIVVEGHPCVDELPAGITSSSPETLPHPYRHPHRYHHHHIAPPTAS